MNQITQPGSRQSPVGNPQQHVIDFTFVLQNVNDQSKVISALRQEISQWATLADKNCALLDSHVQRIAVIETKVDRIERDLEKLPTSIQASVNDIKQAIENSIKTQREFIELKLNPITTSVQKIETDSKEKFEKVSSKIDELNQFRWKTFGITVGVASVISIGAAFAARAIFS
jgi:chromosome segregation ATPase